MFDPTLFLASLREILKDDVASLAYTDEELCFLANYECPLEAQLPYDDYDAFIQQLTEKGKAAVVALPNYNPFYQVHQLLAYERLKQHGVAVKAIVQMEPNGRNLKWLLDRKDKQERLKRLDRKKQLKETVDGVDGQTLAEAQPEHQLEAQALVPETEPEIVPEKSQPQPIKQVSDAEPAEQVTKVRKKRQSFYTGQPVATNIARFKEVVPPVSKSADEEKRKAKSNWAEKLLPHARRYMR